MRALAAALTLSSVWLSLSPAPTRGQERRFFGRGTGAAAGARAEDDDPTAAATIVPVDARTQAITTLDALVLEVPGALARRTGSYGAATLLSLRGTEPRHATVMLGDVPLDGVDDAGFDLSTLPPALLSRIEVYRGGAPLWLGSGAIGGVLRLVPRSQPGTHGGVSLGAGAYALYTAQLYGSATAGDVHVDSVAGLTSSVGDFPFYDDNGTRFTTADDFTSARRNGASLDGYLLSRLAARALGGDVELVVLGFSRRQGVPGSGLRPTMQTQREVMRGLVAATWNRRVDDQGRVAVTLATSAERSRFYDPLAEVAQSPSATDDLGARLFASAKGSLRATPWLDVAAVVDYRLETLDPHDALARVPNTASARHTAGAGAEARFFGERWELRASARGAVADARLAGTTLTGSGLESSASTTFAPTLRAAGSVTLADGLALAASFARGVRFPSTVELFGDRGYLVGRVGLRPETSYGGDVGLVWHGRAGSFAGSAELRGFGTYVQDLVRYTRTSAYQQSPENIDEALLTGVEAGAHLLGWNGRVVLASALTWLVGRDLSRGDLAHDLALPLRPDFSFYARLAFRLGPFGPVDAVVPAIDVTYVGSSFVDVANTARLSDRVPIGASLAVDLWSTRLRLAAILGDIGDVGGQDLLGFPLPGRTFALALTVRD